jgi:hypothetical protein
MARVLKRTLVAGVASGFALTMLGCITDSSPGLLEVTEGCDELAGGADFGKLEVDERVRQFLQAVADLDEIGQQLQGDVLNACAAIATELGAADSWSRLEEGARIRNDAQTGACDAAGARVSAIMDGAIQAGGSFALLITRGACVPNFELQASCEAGCESSTVREPGTVETRCEPGSLRVTCDALCVAGCEGTPEQPANCMGQCESACQGECKGACLREDGTWTENDPSCHGKCSAQCNGTCQGLCKVEPPEGIACGDGIACRGGCTGSYSAPECVSEFTPPSCSIDAACYASCAAEATANAVCEPPSVTLVADLQARAHGDVTVLVSTLEHNLPSIFAAAEARGRLAQRAAERLAASAESVAESAKELSGKSLACAGAAATAIVDVAAVISVSFQASAELTTSCASRTL